MVPPRENVPPGHFEQPPLDEPWEFDSLSQGEPIWSYENLTDCNLHVEQWLSIMPEGGQFEITYDFGINLPGGSSGSLNLSSIRAMGFQGSGAITRASMAVYINGISQPVYVLAGENKRIQTQMPDPCDCIHIIADYMARTIRFLPC